MTLVDPAIVNAALTAQQRQRFQAAAQRALRARRSILLLAAHACGHTATGGGCALCHAEWPCPEVFRTARPALEALADLDGGRE